MNIQLRKYATGDKFWYSGINDFDKNNYNSEWNYDFGLVAGDTTTYKPAWESKIKGVDPGRYIPTDLSPEYGEMGQNKSHYNYAKSVEEQPWYIYNNESMFDSNKKLTDFGIRWVKDTDKILPENVRVFNPDGTRKKSITTKLKDAQGRYYGKQTYDLTDDAQLYEYIMHTRKDQTIGSRHDVFTKKGKRYFYVDNNGQYHWVSPEDAKKYKVSEKPVEWGWDDNPDKRIYWEDYELLGPSESTDQTSKVDTNHNNKYGFDWDKIRTAAKNILGNPNLLEAGRLAGNLINNERVYDEYLKGITPVLRQTYNTHRQVVGDEATKQAYYRRAAQGETQAAKPFTADADRQVAYMNEAKRIGDDLRAQGDLADNQEIRRTSDESNQHQWANIQRATEVANANHASIAQANASKHALLAQKHSAQWSTLDNYLKGIEYRQREKQAKRDALQDQYNLIDYQERVSNDPELIRLQKEADDAWNTALKAGKTPSTDVTVRAKLQALRNYQYGLQKQRIQQQIESAKSGTKITTKFTTKQDLLYKSAKDVVEHFQRMSKLSLDAQKIRPPKIEKLTSHPKGSTRKYQQGGTAPFTIFTPVALGGSSTTNTQTESTSATGKSSGKDETLNVIKDLFKELKGLPSDVNGVYAQMSNFLAKAKAFGEEITSDDLASIYLSQMQQINHIKFSKERYDKTAEKVAAREANGEYAIRSDGRFVVQNINTGELGYKTLSELKDSKEFTPITNGQLMQMRALDPSKGFQDDLLQIADNATSMSEIAKFLKAQLPSLGNSEGTIEGYTKKQSNDIVKGLEVLQDAPDGDYKYTKYTKEQQAQAQLALKYLASILPNNMKALLSIRAYENGTTPSDILASLVNSGVSAETKLEFDAVTGKAAKDADGKSKGLGDMDPAVAFFMGIGDRNSFVIQDKTRDGLKIDTISMPLLDAEGHGLSNATLQQLKGGKYAGQLNVNSATMGGVRISPNGVNNVLLSGGNIYQTELPIDEQAAARGIIQPDLSFLKKIELADAKLRQLGITDRSNLTPAQIDTINKVYKENGLPIIYNKDGNGNPVLTSRYRRFAMIDGIAPEEAFEGDMEFNDGAISVDDEKEREQFESMMKTVTKNDKYKIDNGYSVFGQKLFGGTRLFKGVIYIPMSTNTVTALAGTGYKGTANEYNEIERKQQQADFAREKQFTPAGSASNLNI